MKKFTMLALALSLFLVACGEKKEEQKPAEQPAAEATTETTTEAAATETTEVVTPVVLEAKTEDGKVFTVSIVDGVATVTDEAGNVTELKNAESADGERYADEAGNEIHIKGEEGIITLGNLKEATITVTEEVEVK